MVVEAAEVDMVGEAIEEMGIVEEEVAAEVEEAVDLELLRLLETGDEANDCLLVVVVAAEAVMEVGEEDVPIEQRLDAMFLARRWGSGDMCV